MTTLELVVAVASLITAIAAIVGLYLTRRESKENREGSGERNRHLSDVVKNLEERNGHLSDVVKNLTEIVGIQKREMATLANRLDALVSEQQRRVAIAERQLLDNQQQQKFGLIVAGFKALSWMYDRGWLE